MKPKTNTFYNRFSIFYPLVDLFLKPQKICLVKEINQLPNGKLLEIGVGNGSHLGYYKNHQIVGIDISSAMLKNAEKHQTGTIELVEMNGEDLIFAAQSFDYIVISHVIAVTENPEKLILEAFRVLKSNGKLFILNHFTPNNWLKYIDQSFQFISVLFHFKSVFQIDTIKAIQNFKLEKEVTFGKLAYFKLLVYTKN